MAVGSDALFKRPISAAASAGLSVQCGDALIMTHSLIYNESVPECQYAATVVNYLWETTVGLFNVRSTSWIALFVQLFKL